MTWSFRSTTETITSDTAEVVTHDKGVPKGGLARICQTIAGVGNELDGAGVNRYRIKMNGTPVWSLIPEHLRALQEGLIERAGGNIYAATDLTYTFPIDLLELIFGLPCGIPLGPDVSVETDYSTSSVVGTSKIFWKRSLVAPTILPRLMGKPMNIGASITAGEYLIKSSHMVAGFILPLISSTGITALRCVHVDKAGKETQLFNHDAQVEITESQRYHSPQALTSYLLYLLDAPVVFEEGSKLEATTGAGSADGNEIVLLEGIDLRKAA